MRPLAIVGAGGFGREVLSYAHDLDLEVAGFVDDNSAALANFDVAESVLGSLDSVPRAEFRWIIAIGNALVRRRIFADLKASNAEFATMVHPTCSVAQRAQIAEGSILCPFVFVGPDSSIGDNVILNTYTSAAHDSKVGSHTVFSPYAVINGNVTLGEATFLGTNATVTPGVTVGGFSKIGAGAVVMRDAEAGSLLLGMPATGTKKYDVPAE